MSVTIKNVRAYLNERHNLFRKKGFYALHWKDDARHSFLMKTLEHVHKMVKTK